MADRFTVSPELARSKLRDDANKNNEKFVTTLLKEGVIGPNYNDAKPKSTTGRSFSKKPDPIFSARRITSADVKKTSILLKKNPEHRIFVGLDSPWKDVNQVKISDKFNGTPISTFFAPDGSRKFKTLTEEELKVVLPNLYVHSMLISRVNAIDLISDVSIIVSEGVYSPGINERPTPTSVNDRKRTGKTIVYKVVNAYGKVDNAKTYDLALKIKDSFYFEELTVAYDTMAPDGSLTSRLIVTLPKIDKNYFAIFNRKLSTTFNNFNFSQNEIVELSTPAKGA